MKEAPNVNSSDLVYTSFPLNEETEKSVSKPLLFVLVILGIGGLGMIGVGIAGSTGAISNLNHIHSFLIMVDGVLLIPFGAAGMSELMKARHSTQSYIIDLYEEDQLDEKLNAASFGFQTVRGFTTKTHAAYIIADNPEYLGDSPLKLAKAELLGFFSEKKRNSEAPTPSNLSEIIRTAAQEYKIHLMPKPEHMETVVTRLIEKIAVDEDLKAHVAQYKVLLGQENEEGGIEVRILKDSHDGYYPRIVIYAESKESGQAILDAVLELFPDSDELGDGLLPRGNTQINNLVYYANGSGGIKNKAAECGVNLQEGDLDQYELEY